MTLGAGSAAPNTSGEASDGEKSDGETGDALPSSATNVGGAVDTGGEGSGVERGGGSSRDGQRRVAGYGVRVRVAYMTSSKTTHCKSLPRNGAGIVVRPPSVSRPD